MDTAGTTCAACLYDSGKDRILAEISEEIGKGHAERLMGIISDVLDRAKISYNDIGKIITTIGPGSFTGIRVGVATARGFGLGLGIPVVGVTNLEVLMEQARRKAGLPGDAMLAAVIKAGRDEYYCQCSWITGNDNRQSPFLATREEIRDLLEGKNALFLCGSAAEELAAMLTNKPAIPDVVNEPTIRMVAALGSDREQGDKRPEPLYLRKPDAKPQFGFAVERV